MADNDVQLDNKKRARRRLVGACALALVAAIVLPMVMDSEPRPAGNELQIRIPSQEGSNFAQHMIPGAAAPSAPSMPSESAPAPVASAPRALPPAPVAVQSAVPAATPAPRAVAAASSRASSSVATSVHAASSSAHPATQPATEAVRAQSILDGHDNAHAAAASSAAAGHVFVQIGVFRDAANAREVQTRASAAGVKTTASHQGEQMRVRAGPFADRAAADAAVAKLKKAGLQGFVTSK